MCQAVLKYVRTSGPTSLNSQAAQKAGACYWIWNSLIYRADKIWQRGQQGTKLKAEYLGYIPKIALFNIKMAFGHDTLYILKYTYHHTDNSSLWRRKNSPKSSQRKCIDRQTSLCSRSTSKSVIHLNTGNAFRRLSEQDKISKYHI